MGWWPSKLIVLLNIIVLIGFSLIGCVIAGQILSAVSPNGSMSVVVGRPMLHELTFALVLKIMAGIIIVAVISWVVSTFGIQLFHQYERQVTKPLLPLKRLMPSQICFHPSDHRSEHPLWCFGVEL